MPGGAPAAAVPETGLMGRPAPHRGRERAHSGTASAVGDPLPGGGRGARRRANRTTGSCSAPMTRCDPPQDGTRHRTEVVISSITTRAKTPHAAT